MAGRALAFSHPEIVRLAKERFVAVACDDWYQRRRNDAEGKFFRGVADQGPRDGRDGATRQGIYALTADGTLLSYRNAGQSPEATLDALRAALHQWERLPESRRAPAAVKVPDPGPLDGGYTRKPPAGGVVVNVFTRALDEMPSGDVKPSAVCKVGGGAEAARDHLWITRDECKALAPAGLTPGQSFAMPQSLALRLVRFHLVDDTRGEPPFWRARDVRRNDLQLTVASVESGTMKLRLTGSVLLATDANAGRADRGYDASVAGDLTFDLQRQALATFDVVVLGNHWGEGTFTRGARPGRQPLGIVFQLADGRSPGDGVPPQAARDLGEYLSADASR